MRGLTILFDPNCGLCRRARAWLERQESFLRLEFVGAGTAEARRRFPELDTAGTLSELTVVSDDRQVFQGPKAWVMCLWALPAHRKWARTLASPAAMPLARAFLTRVSSRRRLLSVMMGLRNESRA